MPHKEKQTPPPKEITQVGRQTWKHLSEVHRYGYDNFQVFRDFIDTALYALLSMTYNLRFPDLPERLRQNKLEGPYEEEYLKIVARYRENKDRPHGQRPADHFGHAWGALQMETHEYGHDVLGDIFMRELSQGDHGQFFTPVPLCDMMAHLTGLAEGETATDPACGSGRFFISLSKLNPNLSYVGVDLSDLCAKMTVLNMWMFDLNADIYCGDSLSQEMHRLWKVRRGGYVYELDPEERLAPPVRRTEQKAEPIEVPILDEAHTWKLGQQSLFDLGEFTQPQQRRLKQK
jgi:hypothetical protein